MIVTPGGCLQVHRFHPATFVHALLLMVDKIQFFGSVSYIHRTVEICPRDIKHHNVLVNTHAHPVTLSDWEYAKALVKK